MTKKLFAGLVLLVISIVAFGIISASAETEGVLTYSVSNGEARITSCDEYAIGELVIPSTLGGYPVTSISDYAFYYCSSLESIAIPDSVTSIGEGAFWRCRSLVSITIPDSVTSIGYGAFLHCSSLESVTIGDSVTSIGEEAFYNCNSLESVTIPDSVTSIGELAFDYCSSLESITIPDSVTSIGEYAFYGCDNLVIYGYEGSVAQQYATDNNIPFVLIGDIPESITIGDANGDGEVDFTDAIVVLKHDAGVSSLTGDSLKNADTNGDGEVDFVDAIQILKYDSGLISSFK